MSESSTYQVVSPSEAAQEPYPYVRVNEDRTVRELHDSERRYLEEPFSPFDGGRPYVKAEYESLNGWGSIEGFCHRRSIPREMPISAAPSEDPDPPMSKEQRMEWLRKKIVGLEVIERPDGSVAMKRQRPE